MPNRWRMPIGMMAGSIVAGLSTMPFSPFGVTETRGHNPFIDGIKEGPKGSIDDLFAKSNGKRSKRAKRRKGEK